MNKNKQILKQTIDMELEGITDDTKQNIDDDACSKDEINSIFDAQYESIIAKKIVDKDYILHLDATLETNYNIAIGTSGSDIHVCNVSDNGLHNMEIFTDNSPCIGVKFDTSNSNILLAGHNDACIKMWDLRTVDKPVNTFINTKTNVDNTKMVFSCFDLASNNVLLAAGTDLHLSDAYILYWDARNSKMLGGYWEYHKDDITQAKFHPNDPNKLATGSTDGLINLFDLSQPTEDDAIENTLNSNSSIEQITWYNHKKSTDSILATTHTFDAQIWDIDLAEMYAEFPRDSLAESMKRNSSDYIYTAGNFVDKAGKMVLLVGSNHADSNCLRGLKIRKDKLVPCYNFIENNQKIRSSCYNSTSNHLITAGEEGIVNVWKLT